MKEVYFHHGVNYKNHFWFVHSYYRLRETSVFWKPIVQDFVSRKAGKQLKTCQFGYNCFYF